jgi:hypothetical protein
MSKYLELFAKAIGMPKPIERSRYELENNKSQLAEDGGRKVASTLEEPSSPEEEREAEPKKRTSSTKQALKTGNNLLRGYRYVLDCTCGSWGHLCEGITHRCPTNCIKTVKELFDDAAQERR